MTACYLDLVTHRQIHQDMGPGRLGRVIVDGDADGLSLDECLRYFPTTVRLLNLLPREEIDRLPTAGGAR